MERKANNSGRTDLKERPLFRSCRALMINLLILAKKKIDSALFSVNWLKFRLLEVVENGPGVSFSEDYTVHLSCI